MTQHHKNSYNEMKLTPLSKTTSLRSLWWLYTECGRLSFRQLALGYTIKLS